MGDMTKTEKQALANGLSEAMIDALDRGRVYRGRARCFGRENTLHALHRRGLIDDEQRWTKLGFEIAALVLDGDVPTYDEAYPVVDEQLVGRYVTVSGATAHRGFVVRVTDAGRRVHVQTPERVMVFDSLNVSLLDEAAVLRLFGRQVCRKRQHPCVPFVTLTFPDPAPGGRLHWCAEHADDANAYRADARPPAAPEVELGPVATAQQRTDPLGQLSAGLSTVLAAAEQLKAVAVPADVPTLAEALVRRARQDVVDARTGAIDSRAVLLKVRDMLDGWIEGARENHDGLGHRGEADPCWETFHVSDIRRMIDDTARELGVEPVCEVKQ